MLLIKTLDGELVEQTSLPAWLKAGLANLKVAILMAATPDKAQLTHWGVLPGPEAAAAVAAFSAAIAKELAWYGLELELPLLAAEAVAIKAAAEQLT